MSLKVGDYAKCKNFNCRCSIKGNKILEIRDELVRMEVSPEHIEDEYIELYMLVPANEDLIKELLGVKDEN